MNAAPATHYGKAKIKKRLCSENAATAVYPWNKIISHPIREGCPIQAFQAGLLTCASPVMHNLPDHSAVEFLLVHNLHAYSGGTVRDFHPVPYSPSVPVTGTAALEMLLTFRIYCIAAIISCQEEKVVGSFILMRDFSFFAAS